MFGLKGVAVHLGLILSLLSTLLCIIYGVFNWNKGMITDEELKQEEMWNEEDEKVKEN